MVVKLLGAALVVAAGAGVGWQQAARLERRVRELRSLTLALRVLEKEIAVGATPLPLALERAAGVAEPAVARLLRVASGRISDGSGRSTQVAWEEALRAVPLCLAPPDLEVLHGLGVTLGTCGRADQIRHISLVRERLAASEQAARDEEQRQGRLYRYLGVLVPLALLLVVW